MHDRINSYRVVGCQYSLTLLIDFLNIKVIRIYGFFKKANATKVYKVNIKFHISTPKSHWSDVVSVILYIYNIYAYIYTHI